MNMMMLLYLIFFTVVGAVSGQVPFERCSSDYQCRHINFPITANGIGCSCSCEKCTCPMTMPCSNDTDCDTIKEGSVCINATCDRVFKVPIQDISIDIYPSESCEDDYDYEYDFEYCKCSDGTRGMTSNGTCLCRDTKLKCNNASDCEGYCSDLKCVSGHCAGSCQAIDGHILQICQSTASHCSSHSDCGSMECTTFGFDKPYAASCFHGKCKCLEETIACRSNELCQMLCGYSATCQCGYCDDCTRLFLPNRDATTEN